MAWLVAIWIIIAVLAAVGEMLTSGLFLATIAVAAAVTAIVALLLPFALVQVAVFAALSVVGIAVFRPIAFRALGMDRLSDTAGMLGHSHLVGRRAVVTRTVDAAGGQIRIGEGEFWSARAFNPDETIPAGAQVEILLIDGLTALVAPVIQRPALEGDAGPSPEKGTYSWNP